MPRAVEPGVDEDRMLGAGGGGATPLRRPCSLRRSSAAPNSISSGQFSACSPGVHPRAPKALAARSRSRAEKPAPGRVAERAGRTRRGPAATLSCSGRHFCGSRSWPESYCAGLRPYCWAPPPRAGRCRRTKPAPRRRQRPRRGRPGTERPRPGTKRIVLVGDEQLLRGALAAILGSERGVESFRRWGGAAAGSRSGRRSPVRPVRAPRWCASACSPPRPARSVPQTPSPPASSPDSAPSRR